MAVHRPSLVAGGLLALALTGALVVVTVRRAPC